VRKRLKLELSNRRLKMRSLVLLLLLPGCATDAYYLAQMKQLDVYRETEIARAAAYARKYDALAEFSRTGNSHAQVAAVIALNAERPVQAPLPAVRDPSEDVYKWATLVLPTATAITAGYFGYKLGTVQSDNARMQTEASYSAINAGYASNTAIATAGFNQPPSVTTTNTYSLGTNAIGVWGGTAQQDNSRRCQGSWLTYPSTGANPLGVNAPFTC
jgi:hypothetical protein